MSKIMGSKKSVWAFVLTLVLLITAFPIGVFATGAGYTVTVTNGKKTGGSYEVSKIDGVAVDEVVTITTSAVTAAGAKLSFFQIGYEEDGAYVVDEPVATATDLANGIEVFEFKMPASNVDVYMDFITEEDLHVHQIVVAPMQNGDAEVHVFVKDDDDAHKMLLTKGGKGNAGNKVEIKIQPNEDYRLYDISVAPYNCTADTIVPQRIAKTTDTYIFTMPDHPVQINITYIPGPTFASRDKVSVTVDKVNATDNVRSADKGAYTPDKTFDHVMFAGKSWMVVSNDVANHKMLLLADFVVDGATNASGITSKLSLDNVGITNSVDANSLVAYSGVSGTYKDVLTNEKGVASSVIYTNETNFSASPFLLTVEDIRNFTTYEDQLAFGSAWWLGSTLNGQQAYVDANGNICAEAGASANVRPAVVVDTTKVVAIYQKDLSLPYVNTGADLDGCPGQAWTFVMHGDENDKFEYRSAYRVTNQTNGQPTSNMNVVVTGAGLANQLVITRGGKVQYYEAGKTAGADNKTFAYNEVLAKVGASASKNFNKATDKLYILQGENLYASKLYEIKLHEHSYEYTSKLDKSTGETVVQLSCKTKDGTTCIFNEDEKPQAYMRLADPDFGQTLKFDNNVKAITENHGSSFLPTDFGFGKTVSVKYYNADGSLTTTDWFNGNNAANQGNAPKEDGQYYAIVSFPSTGVIPKAKEVKIEFEVGCDVYKIYNDTTATQGGLTYSHNDAHAVADDGNTVGGRPHAGATVTVVVKANDYNGWVVDGLDVKSQDGKTVLESFNADKYGVTGTAVDTYTFNMPAEHIILEPKFKEHTHLWAEEWSSDGSVHWHNCLAANCTTGSVANVDKRLEYHVHSFGAFEMVDSTTHARVCEVCQYVDSRTHEFSTTEWATSTDLHWSKCTDCEATQSAAHVYKLTTDAANHWYQCVTCGYITGEEPHVYDMQVADEKYLKSAATCTLAAVYYWSCTCGCFSNAEDAATFAGTKIPHTTTATFGHDDSNHWYACAKCDTHIDQDGNELHTDQRHEWQEVVDDKYLIGDKKTGCEEINTYYKVCSVCAATVSGVTFTTSVAHQFTVTSYSATQHWHECSVEGCTGTDLPQDHIPVSVVTGTAVSAHTCTHGTIYYQTCSDCGCTLTTTFEAVDTLPHSLTGKKLESQYICEPATCTKNAIYYCYCVNCESTGTDLTCVTYEAVGTMIKHDYSAYRSHNEESHYKVCKYCGQTDADEYGVITYYRHNFVVEATDTNLHTVRCSDCGYTETSEEHWTGTYGTKATCKTLAVCQACGTAYGGYDSSRHTYDYYTSDAATHTAHLTCDHTGSAVKHTWFKGSGYLVYEATNERLIREATCTSNGLYRDYCVICGYTYAGDVEHDSTHVVTTRKSEHNFVGTGDDAKLAAQADCTNAPRYYCTCVDCGFAPDYSYAQRYSVETFSKGVALGHPHDGYVATDASMHRYLCTRCGLYITEGHTYNCTSTDLTYLKTSANCQNGAEYYYSCDCGVFTNTAATFYSGSASGHAFETSYQHDDTGHWHKCEYCTATDTKEQHTLADATCVAPKTCVCGYTEGEINQLAHSWNITSYDAIKHYDECSLCHATKSATDHTLETTYAAVDANNHIISTHCSICAYNVTASAAHSGGEPTCTEYATCSACKATYGALKAHTTTAATAVKYSESQHGFTCSACDQLVGLVDHVYDKQTEDAKYQFGVTCTQAGFYYYHCECGATNAAYIFGTVAAKGHTWVYQLASSTAVKAVYKCKDCGVTAEVNLTIEGATSVGGVEQLVYNKEKQEAGTVTVTYSSETNDTYKTVTKPAVTYVSTAGTTNVSTITAQAVIDGHTLERMYQIVRAEQSYTLSMDDYTWEGTVSVPTVTDLEENPGLQYKYRKQGDSAWLDWSTVTTGTDLTPGAYELKVEVAQTTNYNATSQAINFTVNKATQTLSAKNITIPYETVGMRPIVKGDRTALTYKVTGDLKDVININETSGIITTIRGGKTKITVYAAETAFFKPAQLEVEVEVTARGLKVDGISMLQNRLKDGVVTYIYGEDVEYDGVPTAALRNIERAVPGWTYLYESQDGTTYTKKAVAPVAAGSYYLYVEVLDDNLQYVGTQKIPFVIEKATPNLSNMVGGLITYMDPLTKSAVTGKATNPIIADNTISGETVQGQWAFIEVVCPHVADSGVKQYKVIFTPTGIYEANYTTATGFATLTVQKRMPGETVLATCSSYTYGAANPTIEIGKYTGTYGDETKPTNVTYYYSLNVPNNMTDGTVWTGQSNEINAGNYYFWAVIGSSDYQTTATAITEFKVEKGTQPTPSFTMTDEKMTIAKADKDRALEYSVDGETWINVPKLDGSGSFVIAGLKKGEHTFKLRAAETQNYKASAVTSTSVTINKFSVAYHPNMGVGSIAPVFVNAATVAAASSTGISRTGYTFDKWNTNPDGSGTSYAAGAELSDNAILYAIWKANDYTVCFDGNGGEGSQAEQGFTYGTATNLNHCEYTKADKVFAGWSTAKDKAVIYADQELVMNVVPSGYVTLYAIWADTCKLSGRIYSCSNSSVNLTLMQGTKEYQSCTVTDLTKVGTYSEVPYEHEYSFDNIPAGLYNIIVKQLLDDDEEKIITEQLYVSGNDTKNITITSSRVKSLLEVKEGTRHVVVGGLAEEAEGKRAENKDVKVVMDVEAVVEAVLPASATNLEREIQRDIASIKRIAKTDNLEYFNADIFETIKRYAEGEEESNTTTQIRDTHNIIEIVVPYDMTGIRSIQIYRAHNGQAIMMKEVRSSNAPADGTYWVEKDKGLIHIYATKFSVYAIGYNAPESVIYVVRDGGSSAATKPAVTGPAYTLCPKDETCPIEPFIDAINNEWYHDGVHFCIEEKIMIGRTTELFVPEGSLLRAEIVAMLWRRAGSPIVDYELTYQDIDASDYYGEALRWATKIGVIDGYDSLHFGPRDNVTREQLAAMLYRYAQLVENDKHEGAWASELTFLDTNKIDDYAVDAIHWCFENKVIEGKPGNIFDPYGDATRAEAACMVQRFCNRNLETAVAD